MGTETDISELLAAYENIQAIIPCPAPATINDRDEGKNYFEKLPNELLDGILNLVLTISDNPVADYLSMIRVCVMFRAILATKERIDIAQQYGRHKKFYTEITGWPIFPLSFLEPMQNTLERSTNQSRDWERKDYDLTQKRLKGLPSVLEKN